MKLGNGDVATAQTALTAAQAALVTAQQKLAVDQVTLANVPQGQDPTAAQNAVNDDTAAVSAANAAFAAAHAPQPRTGNIPHAR